VEFSKFEAGPGDDDRRIDRVVRRFLPDKSLSSIYSSIRKGYVRINDRRIKPETHIFKGDILSVACFLLSEKGIPDKGKKMGMNFPYEIIFKNEHFFVINKPYDVPVQQTETCGHALAETVADYYQIIRGQRMESLSFMPGPLHRLDRKTTGILFFSWSLEGARWFSSQISAHVFEKIYLALVQGKLSSTEEWEDFIEKKDDLISSFHTVRIVNNYGKYAHTKAEPLDFGIYDGIPVTFVKFTISTGRMHQIRVQSAFHGYPLLGDTAYGGTAIHEEQNFFLHAYEVDVGDNKLGLPQSLKAPILTNFNNMLNKILINRKNSIIL